MYPTPVRRSLLHLATGYHPDFDRTNLEDDWFRGSPCKIGSHDLSYDRIVAATWRNSSGTVPRDRRSSYYSVYVLWWKKIRKDERVQFFLYGPGHVPYCRVWLLPLKRTPILGFILVRPYYLCTTRQGHHWHVVMHNHPLMRRTTLIRG